MQTNEFVATRPRRNVWNPYNQPGSLLNRLPVYSINPTRNDLWTRIFGLSRMTAKQEDRDNTEIRRRRIRAIQNDPDMVDWQDDIARSLEELDDAIYWLDLELSTYVNWFGRYVAGRGYVRE